MAEASTYVLLGLGWAVLAYYLGEFRGGMKQRRMWQDHMDRCNRYIYAVDDLDRWCGHTSPHAKLIASHLRAHGEGHAYNAGTLAGNEVCSVNGLREQLKRLDATTKDQQP